MLIYGKEYTVGADPEVFPVLGGRLAQAHELITGSKEHPYAVPKGAVQVDGMALEFNIDPAKDAKSFKENIFSVMSTLESMIGEATLSDKVTMGFDKEFLESVPELNRVLGCSSDFNGWTTFENPAPDSQKMLRTVGGHVHIGGRFTDNEYDYSHYLDAARLARLMDKHVGVYSILWDNDDERRSLYGAAGSFRPKKYGMEYRTLSNSWIFQEKLIDFVFEQSMEAVREWVVGLDAMDKDYRAIIDTSDRYSSLFNNNALVEKWGLGNV